MSPTTPGARLRHLLEADGLIITPGVFDGISAQLVARAGFTAGYLTGAGVAASGFGLPDIGLLTQTEMTERARVIAGVLGEVPLIADADTGYGAPLNVVRTVREYERAGVAAIQLEDQAFPKRCGHLPDKELLSTGEFVAKLSAALEARTDALIVARTDARAPLGLDAAIERANTYAAVGADVIFFEAPQSMEEIEKVAAEVKDVPLLINMVQGGLTPDTSAERLTELGYRIAIHPGVALGAAVMAMLTALTDLRGTVTDGRPPESPAGFFELLGLTEWAELGERYRIDTPGGL
jgi:2-methylisocitrate lyase-like PEP mutase family enzyme